MLAAAAGALIGGLLKKKSAKRARQQALDDLKWQFARMRESAELGGFNPLTALQNTGTAGFGNVPTSHVPLASAAILTNAIQGASDALTGEDALQRERDKVQDQLARVQLDKLRASQVVGDSWPQQRTQQKASGTKLSGAKTTVPAANVGSPFGFQLGTKAEPIKTEYVSQQYEVNEEGKIGKGEPGWLDVVDRDGYSVGIPHVDVEAEGLVVGAGLAMAKPLMQSTLVKALTYSPTRKNLSRVVPYLLNPERISFPSMSIQKQTRPQDHPFNEDGLEIFN